MKLVQRGCLSKVKYEWPAFFTTVQKAGFVSRQCRRDICCPGVKRSSFAFLPRTFRQITENHWNGTPCFSSSKLETRLIGVEDFPKLVAEPALAPSF